MTRAERRRTALGWAIPPATWLLTLEVNYLLARWVCRTGDRWIYSLVGLVGVGIIGVVAAGVVTRTMTADDSPEPDATRRFLNLGAILLSIVSAVGVVALSLPGFVLRPCD